MPLWVRSHPCDGEHNTSSEQELMVGRTGNSRAGGEGGGTSIGYKPRDTQADKGFSLGMDKDSDLSTEPVIVGTLNHLLLDKPSR